MPQANRQYSKLAQQIAAAPSLHDNDNPLWAGPCGAGPLGGITQSMLVRFLSCRERFRLRYVLGLEPHEKWNHRVGYGNMWHACEEALAAGGDWDTALADHAQKEIHKHRMQAEEILKWYRVCSVQFPEYVKYWAAHPDVQNRTPLMQEQVFDVPYRLPSGRVVRLRGKFDSVDLIDGGVWLQENKTKGDVDRIQIERQLRFDLQTMMYLVALYEVGKIAYENNDPNDKTLVAYIGDQFWKIKGVRYNVVRRPFSGGKGSIKQGEGTKGTKCNRKSCREKPSIDCDNCHGYGRVGAKPPETDEEFYERLQRDYIASEPDYWFFRVRAEVSTRDIQVFRDTCLDPLLETACWWYDEVTNNVENLCVYPYRRASNYRTPFGIFNSLTENGSTEYDSFLESGSETGLRRVNTLFGELQ